MNNNTFTAEEMKNAIHACEQMKEKVGAINATLMGTSFWNQLSGKVSNFKEDGGNSLVGMAVVTSDLIPTSHCLYFGSVKDAMEMRTALKDVMGVGGLTWEEVIELIKDGKAWDEEKLKWQSKNKQ